jgi:YD repeat-containing protein
MTRNFLFILAVFAVGLLQAGTITYNHDSAGRLTAVGYASGKVQLYSYDNAGNLTLNAIVIPDPGSDTDGDGLLDAWEQQFFGTLSRDGSGDFDGDGFIDFNEFLAATNPTDSLSLLRVLPPQVSGSVTVQWESVAGKVYRLQYKDDLSAANWSSISGDVTASGTLSSKIDSTAQNRRFYRVILIQ